MFDGTRENIMCLASISLCNLGEGHRISMSIRPELLEET